ncbi:MAG: hypothetical protein UR66_C0007G0059 [Candidatus Moranbacteria bacterium GW2011_GWE1_35_17]|nr:MAG: hypothetical protein UR66_C0007G0059 [Candidatus Moranbacteria bacterium GW2011_GWE1_35_17]KKP82856.1 MAG: hypothetical protein UR82_C0029G0010 [Candidatus Moranbacteria bacterium GW2011_GWF1_35_5]KKP84535.1 MAG: hypothetical protein UR83_C0019G0028 [Candidatus Moranbacteria bacterium GW2011_GWF2_35_54]
MDNKKAKKRQGAVSVKSSFYFQSLVDELVSLLEEKNPQYFNRKWIETNKYGLYLRIFKNVRKDGKIDWIRVTSALPEKWQNRWDDGGFNFQKLINNLVALLEGKNPQYFNKRWIEENKSSLYFRIRKYVRKNGKPDWSRIISALPEKWQGRWVEERCDKDNLAKKWKVTQGSYFSKEEVRAVLLENKEYLYTLVTATTREEKIIQYEIINSLVRLAQNGNLCARKKLLIVLELKCSDWSIYRGLFACPMAYGDTLEKINTCINNYKFGVGFDFLGYLFISLKKRLDGLCIFPPLDLDLLTNEEGSRTYHEVLINC